MATESSPEGPADRTVTHLPRLKPNPEMSFVGYLVAGVVAIGLLPILPILAVVWLVWRLLGSPARPGSAET